MFAIPHDSKVLLDHATKLLDMLTRVREGSRHEAKPIHAENHATGMVGDMDAHCVDAGRFPGCVYRVAKQNTLVEAPPDLSITDIMMASRFARRHMSTKN